MSSEWKRPDSLALPTVWSRFRGLRAMADGRVPDFWVQCVRPEDDDAVIEILVKHFLREEEMCRLLGIAQDSDSVQENIEMWKKMLQQRVSLAVWTGWPNGTPRLVGCNVLFVRHKTDPKFQAKTPKMAKVLSALSALEKDVDVCGRHGVSSYLSAMGLSALPEFRGQALGVELLKARAPLCRALGLRVTVTAFTGAASQKQSERAGFVKVAAVRYSEHVFEGEVVFAAITSVDGIDLKELVVPERE